MELANKDKLQESESSDESMVTLVIKWEHTVEDNVDGYYYRALKTQSVDRAMDYMIRAIHDELANGASFKDIRISISRKNIETPADAHL